MEAIAKKSYEKTNIWDVHKIRQDFPLLHTKMRGKPIVFLDNAASSQKPNQVIDALRFYYEKQHANVHRGVYELSNTATDAFEASRETVRRFINAPSTSEIIFVRGTTEGINLVASSFCRRFLKPGDEILITAMEHHSNIVPWQLACELYGAKLKVVPIQSNGEFLWEDFIQNVNTSTRLVSLTHISNTLGTINPIKKVIEHAHSREIPVCIDGAQATPHMNIDVIALDADFYAFSGHKMFGPTGIGILYGKEKWLEEMPPYHGGGEMIKKVTFKETTFNGLPFKFEAGTPHISGSIGLGAAVDYLSRIDREAAQNHENRLLAYATSELKKIDGLHIIGQAKNKASLISFVVEGLHPFDIGTLLDQQGIAVRTGHHCTEPIMDQFGIPGTVRASFAMYNTLEEVELLVHGVNKAINMLK